MGVSFGSNFNNWYTLQSGINPEHSRTGAGAGTGAEPYSSETGKTQGSLFSRQPSGLTERMNQIDSKVLVPDMKSPDCGQVFECWG